MEQKKIKRLYDILTLMAGLAVTLIIVNLVILLFIGGSRNTIVLLQNQIQQLDLDKRIITSSADIEANYKDEIALISNVFPNEETILEFIQTLENKIRVNADEYTVKFNALTPLPEGDKLFLLMTITMKSDIIRLNRLLDSMERLRYMTHVTAISVKIPDASTGKSDITIALKVYVQKPFTTK